MAYANPKSLFYEAPFGDSEKLALVYKIFEGVPDSADVLEVDSEGVKEVDSAALDSDAIASLFFGLIDEYKGGNISEKVLGEMIEAFIKATQWTILAMKRSASDGRVDSREMSVPSYHRELGNWSELQKNGLSNSLIL